VPTFPNQNFERVEAMSVDIAVMFSSLFYPRFNWIMNISKSSQQLSRQLKNQLDIDRDVASEEVKGCGGNCFLDSTEGMRVY